jgi:cold shock CspA family protein
MSKAITSTTFNLNIPSTPLSTGEKLIFKLKLDGIQGSINGNFTASLGEGSLTVSSLAATTGYNTAIRSYFNSASIALSSNTDEVILSSNLSSFYGGTYIFVPNPLTGSQNTLYSGTVGYGDVDYPFVSSPSDILLIYLSDGTYVESRILRAYLDTDTPPKLHLKLDTQLSSTVKSDLANQTYTRFLLLSRRPDETNTILSFTKRDGKTSYGFLIPEDIDQDVLANIDTITKEVKQKLLNDQSVINDLSGGGF